MNGLKLSHTLLGDCSITTVSSRGVGMLASWACTATAGPEAGAATPFAIPAAASAAPVVAPTTARRFADDRKTSFMKSPPEWCKHTGPETLTSQAPRRALRSPRAHPNRVRASPVPDPACLAGATGHAGRGLAPGAFQVADDKEEVPPPVGGDRVRVVLRRPAFPDRGAEEHRVDGLDARDGGQLVQEDGERLVERRPAGLVLGVERLQLVDQRVELVALQAHRIPAVGALADREVVVGVVPAVELDRVELHAADPMRADVVLTAIERIPVRRSRHRLQLDVDPGLFRRADQDQPDLVLRSGRLGRGNHREPERLAIQHADTVVTALRTH